jgi:hypothetical protein
MTTQSSIEGLTGLRPKWGWFLVLGIALIVLGAVALAAPWRGWAWVMFALAARQIWKAGAPLYQRTLQPGT